MSVASGVPPSATALWCLDVNYNKEKQLTCGAFLSGVFSAELPECMQEIMTEKTKDYYQHFLPISEEKWQSDDFIAYLFKQLGKFLWL